jgi:phage shock protein C
MTSNDFSHEPTSPADRVTNRLVRRRDGKVLAGVCAGLADYFNVDVNLVRVLTVVVGLASGIGLPAYLLAWLVVPEEGADQSELERLIDRLGFRGSNNSHGEAA